MSLKGGIDICWQGQRNAKELTPDETFSVFRAGTKPVGIS